MDRWTDRQTEEWINVCRGLLKDEGNQKLVCSVHVPIYSSPHAFPLSSSQSTHRTSQSHFPFWKVMLTQLCVLPSCSQSMWKDFSEGNSRTLSPFFPYSSPGGRTFGVKESERSTWGGWLSCCFSHPPCPWVTPFDLLSMQEGTSPEWRPGVAWLG